MTDRTRILCVWFNPPRLSRLLRYLLIQIFIHYDICDNLAHALIYARTTYYSDIVSYIVVLWFPSFISFALPFVSNVQDSFGWFVVLSMTTKNTLVTLSTVKSLSLKRNASTFAMPFAVYLDCGGKSYRFAFSSSLLMRSERIDRHASNFCSFLFFKLYNILNKI